MFARWTRPGAALVAAAALVCLAACSSGGDSGGSSPSAAAPASSSAAAAPAGQGQTVTVQMTEFALGLPSTHFAPGNYTFNAVNAGKIRHAISLDGPGVQDAKSAVVGPGQSAPITVNLQPGEYDMYCPVGNHRERGMEVKFTVG